ncbi:MAG TPA: hypothetical protein VLC46_03740 [Thermoanaerobaculia bacterium]|jgi:hypothetical protein|nr:hypothetical protein [Thermoanaerobaculia bacterium]
MRFILFLTLLSTFIVTTRGRSIIDPIGGSLRVRVSSDQGGGTDPDGRNRSVNGSTSVTPDAGPRIDPEG